MLANQNRRGHFYHGDFTGKGCFISLFFSRGTICLPSGKLSHNYGKPPLLMGKSTISMTIFNSYVKLPEGNQQKL